LSLPLCSSLEELLQEYIDVYGKSHWGESSYMRNIHLIEKYIVRMIGSADPIDMNVRCLDHFYQKLQRRHKGADGKVEDPVAPSVLRDINKLLKSCFHQAIRWEFMDKNPAFGADLPHCKSKERPIWDLETMASFNDVCADHRLKLAVNLAFSASLRIGEVLGLTWDCVDISDDAVAHDAASIRTVYLPRSVAGILKEFRKNQMQTRKISPAYQDYNLVIC